jgi:uncharacterized SAM-binding protein YcdF (DUF218 family)
LINNEYALDNCLLENIHINPDPKNTVDQADWLRDKVKEFNIKSLALCASYYHLPRAFLTVLKTFIKARIQIVIIPHPTATPPEAPSPEVNQSQWDLIPGEIERILKYQKKGDVATIEELKEYLAWVWTQ